MLDQHPVYLIRFTQTLTDPDMPTPRYHTTLYVSPVHQTSPQPGYLHEVTGDITSPKGMHYQKRPTASHPRTAAPDTFFSEEWLGYTDVRGYPESWDRVLQALPAPPQQKAFNRESMRTEPVKSLVPLRFYESGEARGELWKCTEWTFQLAVPALRREGLIR